MTTGKNKENFEKWLLNQSYMLKTGASQWFYELPFEMQFNSYVTYYNHIGLATVYWFIRGAEEYNIAFKYADKIANKYLR